MKKLPAIMLLLALLVSPAAFAKDSSAMVFSTGPDGSYELTVTMSPPTDENHNYEFVARLRDRTDDVVISEPTLSIPPGETASVETTNGQFEFELEVVSQPESGQALASAKLTRSGKVVFEPLLIIRQE